MRENGEAAVVVVDDGDFFLLLLQLFYFINWLFAKWFFSRLLDFE